jgi:hypothetical protein
MPTRIDITLTREMLSQIFNLPPEASVVAFLDTPPTFKMILALDGEHQIKNFMVMSPSQIGDEMRKIISQALPKAEPELRVINEDEPGEDEEHGGSTQGCREAIKSPAKGNEDCSRVKFRCCAGSKSIRWNNGSGGSRWRLIRDWQGGLLRSSQIRKKH